jgi:PAS domain S-box-containing protein
MADANPRMADAIPGAQGVHGVRIDRGAHFDLRQLQRPALPARRFALTIALIFVLIGLAWVVLTDVLLYRVIRDRVLIARVETAKGWTFVALAAALLYLVAYRSAVRLGRVWRLTAAIVDSIADGVLLLGEDRTIVYANPAALRMLRCGRQELIGMGAVEFARRFRVSYPDGALVPPDRYASQRVFDEGGPLRYKAVLHPGGVDVVIIATAAAVRTQLDERPVWVVSVMHDITESENLERMRDQFFAAAAHSLKTPVAIIKANAQALAPGLSQRHQRAAAALERQCDRIDLLVQNLLVLARSRSRTLELHQVALELEPLVRRIARESVWSQRHEVRVEVQGSPRVYGDDERLALVIRNMMYEASRLSQVDSPLTVEASPEGDHVIVGVRYRPLPWHEHACDTYEVYDDLGIGRSLASTIVKAHGGALREQATESEVSLWIELPSQRGASP